MNELRTRLTQDHGELDALLQSISEDAAAPASDRPLQLTWGRLETRLMYHMDAEERYLLPLLQSSHPAEVERTLAEHVEIRKRIAELGVLIELHAARQPAIDSLVKLLRDHASQEDQVLYELAGQGASSVVRDRISSMLQAT